MNKQALEDIEALFKRKGADYKLFTHESCKTSEESTKARAAAGMPDAVGAKALLCKLYLRDKEVFATIVLPGIHILDKNALRKGVPNLRSMRFAAPEEMLELAGVAPGCMPPFGPSIFPGINFLIVAEALKSFPNIAFNVAYFEKSIVMLSEDYLRAAKPDYVIDCSVLKQERAA